SPALLGGLAGVSQRGLHLGYRAHAPSVVHCLAGLHQRTVPGWHPERRAGLGVAEREDREAQARVADELVADEQRDLEAELEDAVLEWRPVALGNELANEADLLGVRCPLELRRCASILGDLGV